jgi:hypothetical protein
MPRNLTVEKALPILALLAPGTTLAANLEDPHDRLRVKKLVYRYIAAGVLPSLRLGRRVYVQPDLLAEWIDRGGSIGRSTRADL